MLLSVLLSVVSLLVMTGIAAQTFPPDFNLGAVPTDQKYAWCDSQSAACPAICQNFASVNKCSASDLSYTCTCGDGTTPDLTKYKSTMPFFICTSTFAQCIASHPDDLMGQRACKENQSKCLGTQDPFKSKGEITSSARPTKTQEAQISSNIPTVTQNTSSSKTSNPASTLRVPHDSSASILVAAFLAAFKLFM
ncbi:uncharacterized protein PADG_01161 [Paracoccidioides brasiliensis Pb18]|uniref:DUF7707 domain-containing protein n=2 Tax=Paracoccidioides brasiliensis TaxID=121759 RepID=C1FZD5_PARBD|nr:uncharacterized protein PADG_01161 [Paracoccidioides brasiliensis Pb18]EEH44872.1 hypothetical protein PADG_01161 [Paracoccidioides brasiliensis Pb18]ODH39293.1 hypothetical protein ACO22_01961 [Paracoccidioides brasiliensis]ODH49123.1 hypothetical protein GX48_04741 [Paracoccidioides brasiliensis]